MEAKTESGVPTHPPPSEASKEEKVGTPSSDGGYFWLEEIPTLDMPINWAMAPVVQAVSMGRVHPFIYFPVEQLVDTLGETEAIGELRSFLTTSTYSNRVLSIAVEKPRILSKHYEKRLKRWRFGEISDALSSMEKSIEGTRELIVTSVMKLIQQMTKKPSAPNLRRLVFEATPVIDHVRSSLRPSQIEDWFCIKRHPTL
jgi:hypothetical protein